MGLSLLAGGRSFDLSVVWFRNLSGGSSLIGRYEILEATDEKKMLDANLESNLKCK